jgi:hypothetical protein
LGRGKHRTYVREDGSSKEKALRKLVKQQENEIKRLKSELKTLNNVLKENTEFIKENLEKVQIEDLIENISFIRKEEAEEKRVSSNKKKKDDSCPICGNDIKSSTLPFGKIVFCSNKCGYREVIQNKVNKEETEATKNDRS